MTDYTFVLDDAELARYRSMAVSARSAEAEMWAAAGIVPGATVADFGCGPGAFLADLVESTAPGGSVIGIDQDPMARAAAEQLIERLGLDRVQIAAASVDDTPLAPGTLDAAFVRHVLIHNGPRVDAILRHVSDALRPGGGLFCAETDVSALGFSPELGADERDMELQWLALMRAKGNDPAFGRRLPEVLEHAGFTCERAESRRDIVPSERSPAWTARHAIVAAGLATDADVSRWERAVDARLASSGPLEISLPVFTVVARRP